MKRAVQRFRLLRRFAKDKRGISAIEFALLSPLMIAIYLGGVEISQGIGIDRKVTLTSAAMSNLVAQNSSVSSADMNSFFNAASTIMAPYSTSTLKITVSCLTIDSTGKATVKWSDTRNGTARSVGSVVTLPTALAVPSTTLVLSEVSYAYTPLAGFIQSGAMTLSDKMYMSPRQSTTINRTS